MTREASIGPEEVALPSALTAFRDASPELLAARALQQRIDRKYLLPRRALDSLLEGLSEGFQVVRAEGHLAATYDSCYFDTADYRMYEDHRRGRGRRYKVRIRHHVERRLTFLEVKDKRVGGRTRKARLPRPFGELALSDEGSAFVEQHSPYRADALAPVASTMFRRVTLVGERAEERITIDWDLELRAGDRRERLSDIAIAEIKQARWSNASHAVQVCRALHIPETGVSKYCLAVARLAATARTETFKPLFRAMERLSA